MELNLENEHVKARLAKKLKGFVTPDALDFSVNSRFFSDSQSCFHALHDDMNLKAGLLEVTESPVPVISINETNPLYTNPPELIDEYKEKQPGFDAYLSTWGENELMRLTFTTEEFEEGTPPLFADDKALMFRYVMHELDDDLQVPDGKFVFDSVSTMLH